MKKIILVMMVLILVGCQQNEEEKVVLMVSSLDNPFFEELSQYAKLNSEAMGIELEVLNSENDTDQERALFKALDHVALLILNPVNSEISSGIVLMANDRNIPVVTLDRQVDDGEVKSHIASDNYEGGILAANFVQSIYNENDKILLVEGIQGTSANDFRVRGFVDAMIDQELIIEDVLIGNFSREEAKEVIQSYSQLDEIDIVFAVNDEMALGAVDVMIDKGLHFSIIGFDGTEEAIDAVKNGYLAASIAQQPDMLAKFCMLAVKDILENKALEDNILVDLKVLSIKE